MEAIAIARLAVGLVHDASSFWASLPDPELRLDTRSSVFWIGLDADFLVGLCLPYF